MKIQTGMFVFGLGILAATPACENTNAPPDTQPSFLRATVEGAVAATYEGTGDFHVGSGSRRGVSEKFTLNSKGAGAAQGQSFSLWRIGEGRPRPGSYTLQTPDYTSTRWSGFAAVYTRSVGNMHEAYVARSGEVVITASSEERVQGTFRFTAARYYAREIRGSNPPEGSGDPSVVDPRAPTIEVSGSFGATPLVLGAVVRE